jgi:hypothetical protein
LSEISRVSLCGTYRTITAINALFHFAIVNEFAGTVDDGRNVPKSHIPNILHLSDFSSVVCGTEKGWRGRQGRP